MLYLEDFLELIEAFPSELRDGFSQLRSLDSDVQSGLSKQKERIDRLFANAPGMTEDQRKVEVDAIKQEYKSIAKQADDKVNIASRMHDIVQRYYRKLAHEIANFRYELEADSAGITETLERRVRESEQLLRQARRERKRKMRERETRALAAAQSANNAQAGASSSVCKQEETLGAEPSYSQSASSTIASGAVPPKRCATVPQKMTDLSDANLKLGGGAGLPHVSSAASLKSMGDATQGDITLPSASGEISILTGHDTSAMSAGPPSTGNNSSGHSATANSMLSPPPATPTGSSFVPGFTAGMSSLVSGESRHGRPRKLTTKVQEMLQANMASHYHHPHHSGASRRHSHAAASASGRLGSVSAAGSRVTWSRGASVASGASEDVPRREGSEPGDDSVLESEAEVNRSDEEEESERRWCICIQPSFGNMVACDNDKCPFEWFHYECVNITQPPKGKWYCPHCSDSMKRKRTGDRGSD